VAEPWLGKVIDALDRAAASAELRSTYAKIGEQVGLGASTLRRKFKLATGLSLHQYVLQARIQHARALLGETDMPIKLVAQRLGYSDLYFFTRQFRQHVGVPPAAYRRSRQR
jgi:AraC-like DNA-binding protein